MKNIGENILGILHSFKTSESPIEAMLFTALLGSRKFILADEKTTGAGFFVYPQHKSGQYRADFLIKAVGWGNEYKVWPPTAEVSVCVECDGREFHSTPEQIARDNDKEKHFKEQGIETLRFSGSEIYRKPDLCVNQIYKYLENALWRSTWQK